LPKGNYLLHYAFILKKTPQTKILKSLHLQTPQTDASFKHIFINFRWLTQVVLAVPNNLRPAQRRGNA